MIVLLGLILLGVGAIYFRRTPGPSVGIQFAPLETQTLVGDPFTLKVSFSNYSDSVLKDAKISLLVPDGVSFVGQAEGQRVREGTLGDVGPGSVNQHSFNVIITGGANSVKRMTAKASYRSGQSPTMFETSVEMDLVVGQSAVSLNLTAPQSILNGAEFEIKAAYTNNTGREFKNLRLAIDYPPAFKFKRSSMQAEGAGNNSWFLGDVPASGNGTITMTGSIVGPESSFFGFNGALTFGLFGTTYTLSQQAVSLSILPAPLSVSVGLYNGQDRVVRLGEELVYVISYKNNSDVVMQNMTVKANLSGELYDFKGLDAKTPFNSLTNTITWFAGNTPQLLNLGPGQMESIQFSIGAKDAFPIRLVSDKNFTLNIAAEISSPTVPENTSADRTVSVANGSNKVMGRTDIVAEAFWRDAKAGILNMGPYPPKVNQPTQYTIHWKVVNYATDVSDIQVAAYLQAGVRFTGTVKSNIGTSPIYDQNSGLITWNIPSLPATKGVISAPAEAIFQVEATPSSNQVGRDMPLLSETKLEAKDMFTELQLESTAPAVDTRIPSDTTVNVQSRTVQP
ncbi:MAG: hypothetical protein A2945_00860 [Candidatus Liptonbacteria bacterium RIFCSPLOWO2_01_FULL_52_25]|uniref:DUF11 domain-containing protein n=1 Tax=Candidatus Liptonbacteria bacterium RIFCSPLOWO2_01_FULL_52_25 TaxID=1798650 RepID=A0A1G2CDW3_9BACT|nr:MAG: hypothetical protein A2945_00860 [Candidatus Liptonbacteria bacterium RIFCSPLOWO2_01_FULL_52_25]